MKMKLLTASALLLCAGCTTESDPRGGTPATGSDVETFTIAADTAECEGVGPMRCLVVNGELFYDQIEGYDHVEGQSAKICVSRTSVAEPIPADASAFEYKQVACPAS